MANAFAAIVDGGVGSSEGWAGRWPLPAVRRETAGSTRERRPAAAGPDTGDGRVRRH